MWAFATYYIITKQFELNIITAILETILNISWLMARQPTIPQTECKIAITSHVILCPMHPIRVFLLIYDTLHIKYVHTPIDGWFTVEKKIWK